ncbi:Leucine-rich repeat containing protein [Entamoeba marina]
MQTTLLEKNYLANVMLYMDSIETLVKFICVNKKCEDVRKFLRINPLLKRVSGNNNVFNTRLSKRIFHLIPNLRTIQVYAEELEEFEEEISKIPRIVLLSTPDPICKLHKYRDKIYEISCNVYYEKVDFSLYPNLRKCRIETCSLSYHFPNKKQKLDLLRIRQHACTDDLFHLSEYEDFEKIIIEVSNEIKDNEVDVLSKFATIITYQFDTNIDGRVQFMNSGVFEMIPSRLLTSNIIHNFNKDFFPHKVIVNCSNAVQTDLNVDLSEFNQIEELVVSYDNTHNINIVFPCEMDQPIELKKLTFDVRQTRRPPQTTSTFLTTCMCSKVYTSITYLKLNKCDSKLLFELPFLQKLDLKITQCSYSFQPLTSLHTLLLDNCKITQLKSKQIFPITLKKLKIFNCDENTIIHLKDFQKTTSLTSLSISGRSEEAQKMNLSNYTSIRALKLFQTTFKKYPQRLTRLELGYFDNQRLDLIELKHLHKLLLYHCNTVVVKLPISLHSLYFGFCQPLLENLTQLNVQQLFVQNEDFKIDHVPNTLTQLCVLPYTSLQREKLRKFPLLKEFNIN